MSELDANIIVDGQKVVATLAQSGDVIKDGGAIDATSVIQTNNGPQKVVKVMDINGGGGGGGGDVPQNSNPLNRVIAEDYITAYPRINLDPEADDPTVYLPTFDFIEETPTDPIHFIGVVPADLAETEHDWEFEIVQYVAKEAWYHLIGTDMVFFVTQDTETFDWVTDDTVYPLEAMLPGYSDDGNKIIVNDGTDKVKWVTDNKLENTATGTNSLTILGTTNNRAYQINIGENAVGGKNTVSIGQSASAHLNENCVLIGQSTDSSAKGGIAIGRGAKVTAQNAIQLGTIDGAAATNSTANSFQVFAFQMLDGNTGLIPMARLPIVQCTQAQYDALVSGGTVDANTIYCIIPA